MPVLPGASAKGSLPATSQLRVERAAGTTAEPLPPATATSGPVAQQFCG
ncbi:hypothetical protein [Kitasatospora sp. NPDC059673]